jgi:hypothetical protein
MTFSTVELQKAEPRISVPQVSEWQLWYCCLGIFFWQHVLLTLFHVAAETSRLMPDRRRTACQVAASCRQQLFRKGTRLCDGQGILVQGKSAVSASKFQKVV